MKRMVVVLLWVGWIQAAPLLAQDAPPAGMPPPPLREAMAQMEVQGRSLDLQMREEKLRFERTMNNLQIEEREQALARNAQAWNERGRPQVPPWHRGAHRGACLLLTVFVIVHILTTVWVYQDIKRRNGSGIWVAIALLTGLCGTAVYALVRIGDRQDTRTA